MTKRVPIPTRRERKTASRDFRQVPLSWSVMPMVPPVLMTRTRASEWAGEVSCSRDPTEWKLDSFLRRDGCVRAPRGAGTSGALSKLKSSWGWDRARPRDERLWAAMMTPEVMTTPALLLSAGPRVASGLRAML